MKKHCLLILGVILCLLLFCQATYSQDDKMSLRIMTYNIRHGAGMDNVVDLDRQAAVIRDATPDIVGLQEVDSCVKRSGYIPEAAILGEKTDLYATFGPAIPLTGGKYGVAILSKEQPLSVRNIPLPGAEKRTLLVCEFVEYVFACTHLDLEEENRLTSLSIILEEAARWDKPFFICGDWNDTPTSTLIRNVKKSFVIINNITSSSANYTFPAGNPTSIIDYIASYGTGSNRVFTSIVKRQVINEPEASDHRPVLVEIRMNRYTTGIHSPSAHGASLQEELYDLTGRKWQEPNGGKAALPKGIYVQRGQKILIP